mgnify:CR=1 FL=1
MTTTALVLGGGIGGERDVSIAGATAVADALAAHGQCSVEKRIIETVTRSQLASMPGDVIVPIVHGPWGEGGPLQEMLAADGRPFVGSGPRAARLAMDKIALKFFAQQLGVRTAVAAILDPEDGACPLSLPVILKPIREGSTVGLHVCRTPESWRTARAESLRRGSPYMVEPLIAGRELTVAMLGERALPVIEIAAPDGLYDYEAKYTRDDTSYVIDPELPDGVRERIQSDAVRIAREIGVRHLARVDFMLDQAGEPWLLELNTMPGFTDHSLVPMAARANQNDPLDMPALCARLVDMAMADITAETSV